MADLKITQLPPLTGALLQGTDPFPLADVSASDTKKISASELAAGLAGMFPAGSIPSSAVTVSIAPNSITSVELAPDSVTPVELADQSTTVVQSGLPAAGVYVGQMAVDTTDQKAYVWEGTGWTPFKAGGSVNVIGVDNTTGPLDITATTVGDAVTLSVTPKLTTQPAQFLAGPTLAGGAVTERGIVGADLPAASSTSKGAVQVNGNGLIMNGNVLEIDNTITASAGVYSLVDVDTNGLVVSYRQIRSNDLPIADSSGIGAIKPGTDLTVDGVGTLNHVTKLGAPGTYTKVTADGTGHITSGARLDAADIPDLPASKLTSGTLDPVVIGPKSITREMLADYAIAYIQEAQPPVTSIPIGELWFQESTAQLSMWNGNSWFPVGQARLTAENLRYCGTIDADTNLITGVTKFGTGAGYAIGDTPKTATDQQIGVYFVVNNPGSNIVFVPGTPFDNGDWLLCNGAVSGTGWERIDTLNSGGGGGASNLGDLLDVTLTAPQAGQSLVFTAGGQWVNVAAPAAPGGTPPTSPKDGQLWVDTSVDPPVVKVYDATNSVWVEVGKQPADASETVKGIIELATQAEVDAGTDAVRAVTPATLKQYVATASPAPADASTTVKGIIQLATAAEVLAGTDDLKAVTPKQAADHYIAKNIALLPALP